jgi:predicted pyridoxine 5'-phosphate oxidase superfamily flavin-nucleotide-binding protein
VAKLTQDMKDIAAKAKTFIMSTASKDGKPNGVPVGLTRIISDEEIMVVDIFLNKSRQNIAENPVAAITFWSAEDHYGYQVKGTARVETSGKIYDDGAQWLKDRGSKFSAKAVVVVKVEEVYYIGSYKDSSINLV